MHNIFGPVFNNFFLKILALSNIEEITTLFLETKAFLSRSFLLRGSEFEL